MFYAICPIRMKLVPVFLVGLCPFWVCGQVLTQAYFVCSNYGFVDQTGGFFKAPVYDWTGNLLAGANWRAELYGGKTPDSLSPVIGYGSGIREITPFQRPGYFADGDGIVLDVRGGSWAWLQVKVWDVGLGATYEEASARGLGGYGQSALFYELGGDPWRLDLPTPLTGLSSFSVVQEVPEPSTWAFLGLGLAALWCLRRLS